MGGTSESAEETQASTLLLRERGDLKHRRWAHAHAICLALAAISVNDRTKLTRLLLALDGSDHGRYFSIHRASSMPACVAVTHTASGEPWLR